MFADQKSILMHFKKQKNKQSYATFLSTPEKWMCTSNNLFNYFLTLLSIVSLRRVRSSMAASQFCIRISEANFPHRELSAFLSVEGTWADSNKLSNHTKCCLRKIKGIQLHIYYTVYKFTSYQDAEEVEVFCSPRVVTAFILELGVLVKSIQIFLTKLGSKI